MGLSMEGVPEDQVKRLRERQGDQLPLQAKSKAPIDKATGAPRRLTVDEVVARVTRLNLARRGEAARLIREDRDR
jgi:hypothetical protein